MGRVRVGGQDFLFVREIRYVCPCWLVTVGAQRDFRAGGLITKFFFLRQMMLFVSVRATLQHRKTQRIDAV